MRSLPAICLLCAALASAGCSKDTLPGFEEAIPMSVDAGDDSMGPRLSQAHGVTTLSWMEPSEGGMALRFSELSNRRWQPPATATSDASMFINWADLPAVTPVGSDGYLAHWLRRSSEARYSYDIMMAHSTDGGASWSAPESPHNDGTPTEHGFVSLFPSSGGTGAIWLDGRNTPDNAMTLRSAVIGAEGTLNSEAELDDRVCDCCQTDVALTENGPVAVYRDRSDTEIRDIAVARLGAEGWQTAPLANDGWVIEGCPVNGPAIDAMGDLVVAAWFTGAEDRPRVFVAVSKDAGATFDKPVELAMRPTLGRVDVAIIDGSRFIVSWMESERSGDYKIRLRSMTLDGQLGSPWTVGKTSALQTVPQMARVDDHLYFAWTDVIDDISQVVSVRMKIVGFYD